MGFIRNIIRRRNARRFRQLYDAPEPIDFHGFGELRAEKFPAHAPQCWLDCPDAPDGIARRLAAGILTRAEAEACLFWIANGYYIVSALAGAAEIDRAWVAYERAIAGGHFAPPLLDDGAAKLYDRTLDPHKTIPEIDALLRHPTILKWTDLFFDRKTLPFQTIIGHAGSQQAAHSDSIHMTTYPLGYLAAAWVALEDIDPMSGPLEYYPGSHRLPYLLSAEAGIAERDFKSRGYEIYRERYEPAIQAACDASGLEKKVFLAKKGDVLFWHANLVHGGGPRLDKSLSRKALVCHYFAERVVTYHDLSGNPSTFHRAGIYAPAALKSGR